MFGIGKIAGKAVGKIAGAVKNKAKNSNLGQAVSAFRSWKQKSATPQKKSTAPPLNSAPAFDTKMQLPKLGSMQRKNPFGGADVSTSITRGFGE